MTDREDKGAEKISSDETLPAPSSPGGPGGADSEDLPVVDPQSYELAGEFARGGLGRILRARDRRLRRQVAIKELLGSAPNAAGRFVREALVTARLQHPSIVPVYEAGRWPGGAPFYSMKLVSGRSLADLIDGAKALPDRLALLPNLLAVADAVAYAHSERIIHRDLKPANVLVGAFGETVVIDWGLAKDLARDPREEGSSETTITTTASGSADGGETVVGAVMGTPAYMPPEQASGRAVDERADVYAIGAVIYHLLAAAPPFEGARGDEIIGKVIAGPPPPIEERAPRTPRELAAIVRTAMARDPAERYPSAKELAEDLRRFQKPGARRAGGGGRRPAHRARAQRRAGAAAGPRVARPRSHRHARLDQAVSAGGGGAGRGARRGRRRREPRCRTPGAAWSRRDRHGAGLLARRAPARLHDGRRRGAGLRRHDWRRTDARHGAEGAQGHLLARRPADRDGRL
jgi:hypothetical protein